MEISTEMVKELRAETGAGIMECRGALADNDGDIKKAMAALKEKGLIKAQKKSDRSTSQGLVEAYINLANAHLLAGQRPQALSLLRLADRKFPHNTTIRALLDRIQ